MPELHVRNLPVELHERLREQAAAECRSMSAEVVALLRKALPPVPDRAPGQADAIERLREIQRRSHLPAGMPPAEQLIRADRDSTP